jgi:hypothetical protein
MGEAWVIDANENVDWREVSYVGQPAWLAIRVRFAPTADGVAVIGIQIDRRDSHALTARDLRLVRLPPNWVLFGQAANWFQPAGQPVHPNRKGPREQDDTRHRRVYDLWLQAQQAAPHAPVRWMLTQWPYVSDATMRRWIRKARERAAELSWDKPSEQETQ